jgi:hypothetical protein
MKRFLCFFPLFALLTTSCTQQESEQEPDYDNLVMDDVDDDEEWGQGKEIADLNPQEFILQGTDALEESSPQN